MIDRDNGITFIGNIEDQGLRCAVGLSDSCAEFQERFGISAYTKDKCSHPCETLRNLRAESPPGPRDDRSFSFEAKHL
jgi:hypothetical protein